MPLARLRALVAHRLRSPALALGLACLLVVGLNSPKWWHDFTWDDLNFFVRNDRVYDLNNVPRFFMNNATWAVGGGEQANPGLDTYRPLTITTFALDAAWSGRSPRGYHATNLALHLLAGLALYRLARRLPRLRATPWQAAWAACFFLLQPLLTEAHVWINGRSDVLAGGLFLASLALWSHNRDRERPSLWRDLAAAALLLGAALSKEVVLLLVPLAALYTALPPSPSAPRPSPKAALWAAWPLALGAALALGMRLWALSGLHAAQGKGHLAQSLQVLPVLWLDALLNAVAPRTLSVRFLREDYADLAWPWSLGALALLAGLLWGALRVRDRAPALLAGLLWFVLGVAPVCLIVPLSWYGFGRYLYIPCALLAVGLAQALDALLWPRLGAQMRRWMWAALGAYAVVMSMLHLQAVRPWKDTEQFYLAIAHEQPQRSHGYGGLGSHYARQGRWGEATALLREAVARSPNDVRFLNDLLQALLRTGAHGEALTVAQRARRLYPDDVRFAQALAFASLQGPPEVAVPRLLDALALDPAYPPNRALLRIVLQEHPARADYRRLLAPHRALVEAAGVELPAPE